MAITARFLVDMKAYYGDRLVLVGDTLPNALVGKDDEWMDKLPSITAQDGSVVRFTPPRIAVPGVD
jgi:hypothetical protein